MYRSTFFGLQIGKSGLTTSQYGLDVTSHNIANVETAGYTRQRMVQTAVDPHWALGKAMPMSQMRVGIGTQVLIHDQIRSAYLDRRFRTENTQHSYWQTRTQELRYLESFFDSVHEETSINYTIQEFFKAVKILAEEPVEGSPRTLLQDAGLDLTQQLNMVYQGLIDLQNAHNIAVPTQIDEINRIAIEISELNKSIYIFEVTGLVANDLRDKRNLLVDELSTIIDVEYFDDVDARGNDIFIVRIAGEELVRHDDYKQLTTYLDDNVIDPSLDQRHIPIWVLPSGLPGVPGVDDLDMSRVTGGEMKAYMDMRDGMGTHATNDPKGIPYFVEMVNNLARALVNEVNLVHRMGWTDHPVHGSQTGVNFFHDEYAFWEDAGGNRLVQNASGLWVDNLGQVVNDPAATGYSYQSGYWEDSSTPPVRLTLNATGDWEDQFGVVVPNPSGAGYTFVVSNLMHITAANIRLSDAVTDSAYNIACSDEEIRRGTDPLGQPIYLQRGNNENMNNLYEVFSQRRDIAINGIPIGSFDSYATSIRHDVGNTTRLSDSAARNSNTLIVAMDNQRTSVAGVSLDEEMVHLIKYQHAYSGAARVITAMDEALDRLINGTGRVGL